MLLNIKQRNIPANIFRMGNLDISISAYAPYPVGHAVNPALLTARVLIENQDIAHIKSIPGVSEILLCCVFNIRFLRL
jgi:hypothetical protein